MKFNKLTPEEEKVILHKGTEIPYTGTYYEHKEKGIYTCKRCNAFLYKSDDKFDGHCGWPSFDDEIAEAIKKITDKDGVRTEIICANCEAHLGHVFLNEGFTAKNTRHCVNSISLNFIPNDTMKTEKAYFAGGCFWGVEFYLQQEKGIISTDVGYMGGDKDKPTYKEVSNDITGHSEAIEIIYNPNEISYEELAKLFFEIHDPTQINRQGPDIGSQYRSEIFFVDDNQRKIGEKLINVLQKKGLKVVTQLTKAEEFWHAEDYHQDYYKNNGQTPYCHKYTKRFE